MSKFSKPNFTTTRRVNIFIDYKPAQYYHQNDCYVAYYVINPIIGKLEKKKIRLNHIKNSVERRKIAVQIIQRLNKKLEQGWNPFLCDKNDAKITYFSDACDLYSRSLERSLKDDLIREATYYSYTSYLTNLVEFNNSRTIPIQYCYQFNKQFIGEFLDYVYIYRKNSARTRDCYLAFVRILSSFFLEKGFISSKPTAEISNIAKKKNSQKNRTVIPDNVLFKIGEYLRENNPHYLLACHILFFCFIRPTEMSFLKVGDINFKEGTIILFSEHTKNKNDAVVTIPLALMNLFKELGIEKCNKKHYLFSDDFRPGNNHFSGKKFRDYWHKHLRVALKLSKEYKFYSLKDTGITKLLQNTPALAVRDQARHYSLAMTDLYTPLETKKSNSIIAQNDFEF